jgi:solute carrier family 25 (mitochondrial folate transporter), member 32
MAQAQQQSSFFPSIALDHAAAGLGAGVVAVLCMHPLDLLKVKFQVATEPPQGGVGKHIWNSLRDIKTRDGWQGLYRGVGPNIAGNASSWGLYFLLYVFLLDFCFVVHRKMFETEKRMNLTPHGYFHHSYNMLKKRATGDDPTYKLSPASHLLCAAEASSPFFSPYGTPGPESLAVTCILTFDV